MNNREDIMSKMFVYTMIAIMLVAFATVEQVVAEASFEVQAIATIADGNVSKAMDAYFAERDSRSVFGNFTYAFVGEEWSEMYVGVTYTPSTICQIGAGVGIEQADSPWRVGGSLWAGKGKFSLLVLAEEGGGDFWYRAVGAMKISSTFAAGAMSEQFAGHGPRLDVCIPNLPLKLWVVGLYDDDWTSLASVKMNF
jgi:hypothetical protein